MFVTTVTTQNYSFNISSVAGIASCCTIDKHGIAFDIGACFPKAVGCSHVFITHGHYDHLSAFIRHAGQRNLQNLSPATYYAPRCLVPHLKQIIESTCIMQGSEIQANIEPLDAYDEIIISQHWKMKSFPTIHRVSSLGYILYRKERQLKDEYKGLTSQEISEIVRSLPIEKKHDITTESYIPEIAYTGDTTIDIFLEDLPIQDLLHVEILITEATYIDQSKSIQDAKERGHIHLQQLVECYNEGQFDHIKTIILVHFSAKYRPKAIKEIVRQNVPEDMFTKLQIGI